MTTIAFVLMILIGMIGLGINGLIIYLDLRNKHRKKP